MVSLRNRVFTPAAAIALIALVCAPAHAQAPRGRLEGAVRDATGAAIPGATLTIIDQATNATQTATTSTDGRFSAAVAPGVYSVTASLRGFGRQTRRDVKVERGRHR